MSTSQRADAQYNSFARLLEVDWNRDPSLISG